MAYFICHGLWLYPMYSIHITGFIYWMLIKLGSALQGDIKYMLWVFIYVIGVQGGDINDLWDAWVSSLGLGLS